MRLFLTYTLIFCSLIAAFLGLQKLGQNESVYKQSFAYLSLNYQRIGGWQDYSITKDTLPYLPITENNLSNWDAAIYHCLKQHGYAQGRDCYDSFKASFFPGFPLLWKFSSVGFRGISLINYALYALSIIIVLGHFKLKPLEKFGFFTLLLISPSALIFAIPYSEALFTFSGVLAIHAYLKQKKGLFFLAFYTLLLTRVAGLFILTAILVIACLQFVTLWKKKRQDFWQGYAFIALFSSTLAIGTYLGLVYWQQGSLNAYFQATQLHQSFFKWPWPLQDWSTESFGMSTAAIGAVLLPAVIFSLTFFYQQLRLKLNLTAKEKILAVATLYWAGLFVFELLHSGGIIHSLHRFVFCSPLFVFAAAFIYTRKPVLFIYFALAGLVIGLILWQTNAYAGYFWRSELSGMLFWPLWFILLYVNRLPAIGLKWFLAPLVLVFLWWHTYLLNQLLSNAWIFT